MPEQCFLIGLRLDVGDGRVLLQERLKAFSLPESTDDALLVLQLATQLVNAFLAQPEPMKKPASVVALVGGSEHA